MFSYFYEHNVNSTQKRKQIEKKKLSKILPAVSLWDHTLDGSGKAFSSSSFPGSNLSLPFGNLVGEVALVSFNLGSDFSDVGLVIEGTGLFLC